MFKQNDQFITKAFYFGSERLKTAQSKSTSVDLGNLGMVQL